MSERTDRNERFFGKDGQELIAKARVVIVGLGGLGSHMAQQLAYLGVRDFRLVDEDVVSESSLNRLVGAMPDDATASRPKVSVLERLINEIHPEASVRALPHPLEDARAKAAIAEGGTVIGCLDGDLARLHLTALAMASGSPYLDLASDIDPDGSTYGGRLFFAMPGVRCLSCVGLLDQDDLRMASMSDQELESHDRLYGIRRSALGSAGPAVVSVNGVVASLAVTEFIAFATGLRDVFPHLVYLGHLAQIRRNSDAAAPSCYYCRPMLPQE